MNFTPELKTSLIEALNIWTEAKELIEEARQQKRSLRPHVCQDFFDHITKSVGWDAHLLSDICTNLVMAFKEEGSTNKTPVSTTTLQMLKDDVSRVIHTYLLSSFLASEAFISFLEKGTAQCLFTGITKRSGAGKRANDVDAKGVKRANQDSDEFMDTAFMHGGLQRVKAGQIYPRLLAK